MTEITADKIASLARTLDKAVSGAVCTEPFAARNRLSQADAYAVQREGIRLRLQRGERIVGYKLGFTSDAMRCQMGISGPNIAVLTDAMQIPPNGAIDGGRLIHPRVEPELAFMLKHDCNWPLDLAQIQTCIAACAAAVEVVDSRFFDYVFTLEDNTADNSSAAYFVTGEWVDWPLDIDSLPARLLVNDQEVARGDSSAAMGHPLLALLEAARLASEAGLHLRQGSIILTGGLTVAPFVHEGDTASAVIESLGQARLSFGS